MFDKETNEYIVNLKRTIAIKNDELSDLTRDLFRIISECGQVIDNLNKRLDELKPKQEAKEPKDELPKV